MIFNIVYGRIHDKNNGFNVRIQKENIKLSLYSKISF